jgi:hypothetical protein
VRKRLLLMVLAALVLVGCGEADSAQGGVEKEETSATNGLSRGEGVAAVKLKLVGDSGTSGTATFREISNLGVEAELEVKGLPKPGATYYAHVHEGGCADMPTEGAPHEHEQDAHEHEALALTLALVLPERLLAWSFGPNKCAHGGHDHGHEHKAPAEDLPGNLEVPIPVSGSSAHTGSSTAMLRDVTLERL